MTTELKISVVVPCYNRADFLRPTLDSILAQDYAQVECIVIDGGSTDGTLEILKSYAEKIKYVSEPDEGQADAINKGWKMATGEILTWLNADDLWEPGAAKIAAEFFAKDDADVLHGDCGLVDLEGKPVGMAQVGAWDTEKWLMSGDHFIAQPASFIRKSIIEKVGYLDTSFIIVDFELWTRIALCGKLKYIPKTLAHARTQSGYDRAIFADDQLGITKKFFKNENLPQEFVKLKSRAMSSAYLRGIEYLRDSPNRPRLKILYYFVRALLSDPTNFSAFFKRLTPVLRRRILGRKS